MKNIRDPFRFLFLLLSVSLVITSCKDDKEEPAPEIINSIEYNGKKYDIKDGLIEDYGPEDVSSANSHYNYDFYISNTAITGTIDNYTFLGSTFILYLELFSPGATGFRTGKFDIVDPATVTDLGQLNSKYILGSNVVVVDTNNDNDLQDEFNNETYEIATGGSITVSGDGGTNHSYKIDYDLRFSGGKTLKGSSTTNFKYSDEK